MGFRAISSWKNNSKIKHPNCKIRDQHQIYYIRSELHSKTCLPAQKPYKHWYRLFWTSVTKQSQTDLVSCQYSCSTNSYQVCESNYHLDMQTMLYQLKSLTFSKISYFMSYWVFKQRWALIETLRSSAKFSNYVSSVIITNLLMLEIERKFWTIKVL